MLRFLFISLLIGASFLNSNAQDTLYMKGGLLFDAKVLEVGVRKIKYTLTDEPGSAVFLLRKKKLSRVYFANGKEFITDKERKLAQRKREEFEIFKNNVLNITPLIAMDQGVGFGIDFERLVGSKQKIGLVFPLSFVVSENGLYLPKNRNGNQSYYFSPGLKIYPFGQRNVSYAMGTNLFVGHVSRWLLDYNTYEEVNTKSFRLGIMINNYLTFQVSKHLRISTL